MKRFNLCVVVKKNTLLSKLSNCQLVQFDPWRSYDVTLMLIYFWQSHSYFTFPPCSIDKAVFRWHIPLSLQLKCVCIFEMWCEFIHTKITSLNVGARAIMLLCHQMYLLSPFCVDVDMNLWLYWTLAPQWFRKHGPILPTWIDFGLHHKGWVELSIHFQTSKMEPLKFGDE